MAPLLWLKSRIQEGWIEKQLAATLTDTLGRKVTVGSLRLGWNGGIYLDQLGVAGREGEPPLFLMGQARVDYSYWRLFTGELVIDALRFVSPSLNLVRMSKDQFNFSDILEHIARRKRTSPRKKVTIQGNTDTRRPPLALPESPEDLPRIPLRRIALEDVSIVLEDRTIEPAVNRQLRDIWIRIDIPGPNKPLLLDIKARSGDTRLHVSGDLYLAPLVGRLDLKMAGISLEGFEPYLARLPISLDRPRLQMDFEGWTEFTDRFLEIDEGKPRVHIEELRYGGVLKVETLEAGLPGGRIRTALRAHLLTGAAKLDEASLWLDDTLVLKAKGTLEDFHKPAFDLRLNLLELPIRKLLAHIPHDKLPPAARNGLERIKGQGVIKADLHARGTRELPLLSGWASATGLAVVTPKGTVELDLERLNFDTTSLRLYGLKARALGARAALSATLEDVRSAPRLAWALDAETPDLSLLPLPKAPPGLSGKVVLRMSGGASASGLMRVNRLRDPRELTSLKNPKGFGPLKKLSKEFKQEIARLKRTTGGIKATQFLVPTTSLRPLDRINWKAVEKLKKKIDLPRLEELVFQKAPAVLKQIQELLEARMELAIDFQKIELAAGPHPAGLSGGAEFEIQKGFSTRNLRARIGNLPVGVDLAILSLLESPALEARLELAPEQGSVPLSSVAALAPTSVQQKMARHEVSPDARVAFHVDTRLSAAGPSFSSKLSIEGFRAGTAPLDLAVSTLELSVDQDGIRIPRTRIDAGPVALSLDLQLHRKTGARLHLRTADKTGIDLTRVMKLLPPDRARQLQKILEGSRIGLEARAAADLEDARALFRLRAHHPALELGISASGDDLYGQGDLNLKIQSDIPDLASVAALLPLSLAARLPPVNLDGAEIKTRIEARGTLRGGVDLTGTIGFPGGRTAIKGQAASLLKPGRSWASLVTRLNRLEEVIARLSPDIRTRIQKYRPTADIRLGLNLGHSSERSIVEQTLELAEAQATITTRGMDIPLNLGGTRAAIRATILPGAKPIIDADLSGLRVDTVLKDVPLHLRSEGGFHMGTTSAATQGFALRLNDDPIRLDVLVEDPWNERRITAVALADRWQLTRWVESFVPKDKSITVTGTASIGARVEGRLPHVDGHAWIELMDVQADAPQLRGLGAGLPNVQIRILRDDIVIDNMEAVIGARRFHVPIEGSIREILGVDNVYRADPTKVGPMILSHMGGLSTIKALIGEKQIERIILDQTIKAIVWVRAKGYDGNFVFKGVMAPEDKTRFAVAPQEVVNKYIAQAKQALAEKLGFPKRTYGADNYRMINITYANARVLDEQLNSIWPEFIPFWRLTTTPSEW